MTSWPTIHYTDRLYGQMELTTEELQLLQTPEMQRLHHITIVNNAPWTTTTNGCATKFEHSIAVGFLAKVALKNKTFEPQSKNLFFAALVHDIGTPPFSHTSERYLEKLFNINHEEYVLELLTGSQLGKVITNLGGSIEEVSQLVNGKLPPWSDLINGSIDLDNLDNSVRCAVSMGLTNRAPYKPAQLAHRFAIKNGKLINNFTQSQTKGWQKGRDILYEYIYSASYLAPLSMISRALDFASEEGKLSKDFFRMTNLEAYNYLTACNSRNKKLLTLCKQWNFYKQIYYFCGPISNAVKTSGELSNAISKIANINPEEVTASISKDRRDISRTRWVIQIFVHPDHSLREKEIKEYLDHELGQSRIIL